MNFSTILGRANVDIYSLDRFEDFDNLVWRTSLEKTYLILSNMARSLLTSPVSIIVSKSAFSTSRRVLTE